MATEQMETIIGAQVELTGSLKNEGSIQIYGTVNGDVISNATVFVGESAFVKGPITAKTVEVAGRVSGSIAAESHIELHPKSVVKGDLSTKQLSIKPGALFMGNSKMELPGELTENAPKHKPRLEVE